MTGKVWPVGHFAASRGQGLDIHVMLVYFIWFYGLYTTCMFSYIKQQWVPVLQIFSNFFHRGHASCDISPGLRHFLASEPSASPGQIETSPSPPLFSPVPKTIYLTMTCSCPCLTLYWNQVVQFSTGEPQTKMFSSEKASWKITMTDYSLPDKAQQMVGRLYSKGNQPAVPESHKIKYGWNEHFAHNSRGFADPTAWVWWYVLPSLPLRRMPEARKWKTMGSERWNSHRSLASGGCQMPTSADVISKSQRRHVHGL